MAGSMVSKLTPPTNSEQKDSESWLRLRLTTANNTEAAFGSRIWVR